jgi:hypothetical protein
MALDDRARTYASALYDTAWERWLAALEQVVDKLAQKDIFIEGAMAESFKAGVEALMDGTPTEDDIDEYIARFASLMPQPLVLH